MLTAAREGLMREHEAGRLGTPRLWHPWIKRISNAAVRLSAATLLASGMASSLAARKHKSRQDDGGGRDQANRDRSGGNDRNREDNHGNDLKQDRPPHRDNTARSDGDGHGGHGHQGGKQELQVDDSSDIHSAAQKSATATPTPTPTPTSGGGGGKGNGGAGGNGDSGGGNADGGGNNAGNAGSGLFDSPLATKARRRANDFDNADNNDDQHHTVVDANPDGKSVHGTSSVSLTTGPDGLEIQTHNISYTIPPTPTPEPLPRLELPTHEPGFPFGEDFPFGNTTVAVGPTSPEPSDSGDTGNAPAPRAEPIPASNEPAPINTDGGDNTMDFSS
jgi:hypothetical protein